MKLTLLASAIAIAAAVNPLHAGGPVIIEDAYEAEPQVENKAGWIVPVAILLIIAAAASGGSKGGGDVCNGDEPAPTPGPCP